VLFQNNEPAGSQQQRFQGQMWRLIEIISLGLINALNSMVVVIEELVEELAECDRTLRLDPV